MHQRIGQVLDGHWLWICARILLGLVLSYVGGALTGGQKGVVDIPLLSGIGLLGGAMLRAHA